MPATQPRTSGDLEPGRWPGERLGLPESGPGSVGRVGRRIAALAIDWVAAIVIALLFAPYSSMLHSWVTLGIFALMQILFIPTIGGSVGHRLVGLRVLPVAGGWVGPWRPVVRTALLVIVLPAVVWDSDQRGFHDKIAGTVLIRA
ncbi:RDD family protein [Agromyces sp. H66]|uniref:RDD family protein n=1 Tax=Agromyces sp. H66 TaxID=2529859 RepID=UPI0010AB130D|nr:RDD family protein [Agromyces sp. H66]